MSQFVPFDPEKSAPGVALSRALVTTMLLTAPTMWAAFAWPHLYTGFFAVLGALAALEAWVGVVRSHRAWKKREDILAMAHATGNRFTTRRRNAPDDPENWD